MSASINCPHCQQRARIRSSREVTATYRQLHMECRNDECGHVFGAGLSVTHTIVPSMTPNPEIELHIAPPRRRVANDNVTRDPEVSPAAANENATAARSAG